MFCRAARKCQHGRICRLLQNIVENKPVSKLSEILQIKLFVGNKTLEAGRGNCLPYV